MKRGIVGMLAAVLAVLGCFSAPAVAAKSKAKASSDVKTYNFAAGPYLVRPGANAILLDFQNVPKPNIDGYMIEADPNLHYALGSGSNMHCCGGIPPVDVIHLHHGVWLSDGQAGRGEHSGGAGYDSFGYYPFMASGEEKTRYILPPGFGYPVGAHDHWVFNYMIHNLWPTPRYVYVTYRIKFVPATTALAKTLIPVHPIWMDVRGLNLYPVFDVKQFSGKNGKYTYPYMDPTAYPAGATPKNQFVVDHPGVLVATAGHVHPGGLWTQLDITRPGTTAKGKGIVRGATPGSVELFRSAAHYWDPRGPISWDMAMKGTSGDWRPVVKTGDVLSISATYETKRASWYESMGIMVVWEAWNDMKGVNPFRHKLDLVGHVTHGHLAENNHHGGSSWVGVNLSKLPSCTPKQVDILHFNYNPGGFYSAGKNRCVPTVTRGQSLTFFNQDANLPGAAFGLFPNQAQQLYVKEIFHTVTSCQNPCGLDTGISYPLAQPNVASHTGLTAQFDSGQLGYGVPATGSLTWSTPTGLKPGLYTYFCRIHPFMRGVFRVVS